MRLTPQLRAEAASMEDEYRRINKKYLEFAIG